MLSVSAQCHLRHKGLLIVAFSLYVLTQAGPYTKWMDRCNLSFDGPLPSQNTCQSCFCCRRRWVWRRVPYIFLNLAACVTSCRALHDQGGFSAGFCCRFCCRALRPLDWKEIECFFQREEGTSLVSSEEGRTKCTPLSFFKCHYQRSMMCVCVCVCVCVCGEDFS